MMKQVVINAVKSLINKNKKDFTSNIKVGIITYQQDNLFRLS